MKRSEAITVIIQDMDEWLEKMSTDNEIPSWVVANNILNKLEQMGMIPPKVYKDVNDFALTYCDDPGKLIEVYAKNEWENE